MVIENFPAISDPLAMARFGESRRLERDVLLDSITLRPGIKVLDIQSAAGFVSDRIYELLKGEVACYCLEPCEVLRQRINTDRHIVINNPVERFHDLADNSVDVAVGLAGFHHSQDHSATMRETLRVLKPGGEFAVCDVIEGSSLAGWLNEFVDANSVSGHQGRFIRMGEARRQMEDAGFNAVTEEIRDVPWLFDSYDDLKVFFRGLFGLQCSDVELDEGIARYHTLRETSDGLEVEWSLLYLKGVKAGDGV